MNDRELDAALAEWLFGWRDCRVVTNPGRHQYPGLGKPLEDVETVAPIPNYSTGGDGMLKVLAAMQARGYDAELCVLTPDTHRKPNATFSGRVDHCAEADTLPRAVALAALETKTDE